MKTILTYVALLMVAVVSTWLTTFQQVTVHDREDLRAISCGWPLTFVTSNQEWRDPPYPHTLKCLSGEWGDSIIIQWKAFLFDVSMFYLLFVLLVQIKNRVTGKGRKGDSHINLRNSVN